MSPMITIEYKRDPDDKVTLPTHVTITDEMMGFWSSSLRRTHDCYLCGRKLGDFSFTMRLTLHGASDGAFRPYSSFHVFAVHEHCAEITAYGASRLPSSRDKWCMW